MKTCLFILFGIFCGATTAQPFLKLGPWRISMQLNDSCVLPFNMEVHEKSVDIINAEERITADEITYSGDSVFIKMPLFDSELRGKFSETAMTGVFVNHARTTKNRIPFHADYGLGFRFIDRPEKTQADFNGRWEVEFAGEDPETKMAVGEFKQDGNRITGTFLTLTGDYRYLQGDVGGNRFFLSAFDGSHSFLFDALLQPDGTLNGNFYSGLHWHGTWTAKRNEKAKLSNADSLTFIKPGYDRIRFTFPDTDSNMVSLSDKKFQNKIVIVQIMGTWCPNCMDETAFLAPFYKKYKDKGVEIIGLDFERTTDFQKVKQNLLRLKNRYSIDYTLLFAGSTDPVLRLKALPMLDRILSFPTTIFIDRKNKVRKIHTGFSGPATGAHYEKWENEFYELINRLLSEK